MPINNFKIRPGHELVIKINRRKGKPGAGAGLPVDQKHGSILTRKPGDYLARRIAPVVGGLFQFYDLAQILNDVDEWITKNVSIAKDPYLLDEIGGTTPIAVDPLTELEKKAIVDDLVAVGAENFASTYRPVKKSNAAAFPIMINGTDSNGVDFEYHSTEDYENWTEDGLVLTPEQLTGSALYIASENFTDAHIALISLIPSNVLISKITTSYDYDADPVTYTPQANDIFFLVPTVCLAKGYHGTFVEGSPTIYRETLLNYIYRFFERYFDEPEAITQTTTGEMEAYERMVAIEPTRVFTVDNPGGEGNQFEITPGGDFLDNFDGENVPFDVGYAIPDDETSHRHLTPPTILSLKVIIKQGSTFFYFWS